MAEMAEIAGINDRKAKNIEMLREYLYPNIEQTRAQTLKTFKICNFQSKQGSKIIGVHR